MIRETIILFNGRIMEIALLLRINNCFKTKFYLNILNIRNFHLLSGNSICMISTKLGNKMKYLFSSISSIDFI